MSATGRNMPTRKDKTGVRGVSRVTNTTRWQAEISAGGRHYYLGSYYDFFEAVCARKSAEARIEAVTINQPAPN